MRVYECAIIGGGIAGLQAAIQLGRYRHSVVVVDAGDGRSTLCRGYHNLLGWPDGVSGEALRRAGREQALRYGVAFVDGLAVAARREAAGGANGRSTGAEKGAAEAGLRTEGSGGTAEAGLLTKGSGGTAEAGPRTEGSGGTAEAGLLMEGSGGTVEAGPRTEGSGGTAEAGLLMEGSGGTAEKGVRTAGEGAATGAEPRAAGSGGTAEAGGEGLFVVTLEGGAEIRALRLLIATGVKDRIPDWPELRPCLGITAFICPDCDGWETSGRRTLVLGAGDAGASLALELVPWTRDIVYVNHELKALDPAVAVQLREAGIPMVETPVRRLLADDGRLHGVLLEDGALLEAERAFLGFGGNEVRSSLAAMLGARLSSNRHIEVDPRTKLTSVPHVWAAGDVTAHSEQTAIAMGDGLQAAIWIHKSLTLREPLPAAPRR